MQPALSLKPRPAQAVPLLLPLSCPMQLGSSRSAMLQDGGVATGMGALIPEGTVKVGRAEGSSATGVE